METRQFTMHMKLLKFPGFDYNTRVKGNAIQLWSGNELEEYFSQAVYAPPQLGE